jgi:two-component system, response regulator PdtaR
MLSSDPAAAVLIVEDDALIRLYAAATIEEAGFRVYEASDAEQALRLLEEKTDIGVLFSDIEMSGPMDGLALAHYARSRSPSMKIIVTSGRRQIEAKDLPDQSVFLGKPYRPAYIVEQLRGATAVDGVLVAL